MVEGVVRPAARQWKDRDEGKVYLNTQRGALVESSADVWGY